MIAQTVLSQAKVSYVPISKITVAVRRRKGKSNLKSLERSIKTHGLIHPIVLDRNLELITGLRRLDACKALGWKQIPARKVSQIADPQGVELGENVERKDLTSFERSKQRVAEMRQAEAALKKKMVPVGPKHPSKDKKTKEKTKTDPSKRAVAEEAGVAKTTGGKAERHVAIVEAFPFMQGEEWSQKDVLDAGDLLAKLPKEQEGIAVLLDQPGIPATKAVLMLANLVHNKTPKERENIYGLARSQDIHEREEGLSLALQEPPPPDPGILLLLDARAAIDRAIKQTKMVPFKESMEVLLTSTDNLINAMRTRKGEDNEKQKASR